MEVEALQGEVLVKSQRLSELKVEVCSRSVAVGVLREQTETLQAEKEALERQVTVVSEEADRERSGLFVHYLDLVTPTEWFGC